MVGYQCCLHLQGEETGDGKNRRRYRPEAEVGSRHWYPTTTIRAITTQKTSI
jgi:hypothetical protein